MTFIKILMILYIFSYFLHILKNDIKQANDLLFELYNDGYDLSDILFFLFHL